MHEALRPVQFAPMDRGAPEERSENKRVWEAQAAGECCTQMANTSTACSKMSWAELGQQWPGRRRQIMFFQHKKACGESILLLWPKPNTAAPGLLHTFSWSMSEHRMFENTAVNQALPRGILLLFSCWDELPSKQLLQQPVIHRPYGWALKPEQGWQHTLRAHSPSQQKIRICKHLLYCFRSEQQSNLPDLTVLKSLQQPHFYHSPQRSRHPSMSELLFVFLPL